MTNIIKRRVFSDIIIPFLRFRKPYKKRVLFNIQAASGPSYTARTTAFATATGISDVTILSALSTFDTGLISNSLDSKFNALYPFVGGTSTTHKYNFFNALDTDAAFRLTFTGGWTHSANGALPNGVNAYANTFFNGNTQLVSSPSHISAYLRNTQTSNNVPIGARAAATFLWQINTINNDRMYYYSGSLGTELLVAITSEVGLFSASVASATSRKIYINGVLKNTKVTSIAIEYPSYNIYLGATNDTNSAITLSSKEMAMATIGSSLSDAETTTFYNLVQALQTSLSRQV